MISSGPTLSFATFPGTPDVEDFLGTQIRKVVTDLLNCAIRYHILYPDPHDMEA